MKALRVGAVLGLGVALAFSLAGTGGAVSTGVLDVTVTEPAKATGDGIPGFDRSVIAAGSPTDAGDLGPWVWADEQPTLTVDVGAPTFEDPPPDYRRYTVRVTDKNIDHYGPTTESLGAATVTLPELGREAVDIELDPEAFTDSDATARIALNNPDRTITVKRATVHIGVFPKGGSDRWDHESVTVQVIRRSGDLDDDGLSNAREIDRATHFLHADGDGDGLLDGPEITRYGTDPMLADTDADDVQDAAEIRNGTDPRSADTDGDGLLDAREILELSTDPTKADTDDDGLVDPAELQLGTDPTDPDTDGDGLSDGREVHQFGTDPTAMDTDGDGLRDDWELFRYGTDPTNPDTDQDGVEDGANLGVPPAEGSAAQSGTSNATALNGSTGSADTVENTGPIEAFTPLLESGMYVPLVVLAGALGLRRLVSWVTYP